MKPKNYGTDISSVNTPVRFHLSDGSTKLFNNSLEAQAWFNKNYSDRYNMIEYIPNQEDSDHPILSSKITVTAPASEIPNSSSRKGVDLWAGANYSSRFNKYFYGTSDSDALFGKSRVEGVKKAWLRNPQAMQNWTDGGNAAAIFATLPFAAYATTEYVAPWLIENVVPYLSARSWLEATQATGNTPAWLTPTSAAAIDATLAGSATGASINDMWENGPTVGNVLGTISGLGGLAFEAAPTVMEGYLASKLAMGTLNNRVIKPYKLSRAMNSALSLSKPAYARPYMYVGSDIPTMLIYRLEFLPYRNPTLFQQGVRTSGRHQTIGQGPIMGSRNVDNPSSPGQIKYHPSRTTLDTLTSAGETLYLPNYQDMKLFPRGEYRPEGILFDRTTNYTEGFRPNVQGRWINPENGILITDWTSDYNWPMEFPSRRWLPNNDNSWIWTDLQRIPVTLFHKNGGKLKHEKD